MVKIEPETSTVERFVTSPSALATILIAILGQAIFSIYFQVTNNEQQSALIVANANSIKEFRDQVFSLQTPLSAKVFRIEEQLIQNARAHDDLYKRVDGMDMGGTRALSVVVANQQRVMQQMDRFGERLLMQDKRIGETQPVIQTKIEQLQANIARLEDQQRRIIEALDNLYSQVSKIPPALRMQQPRQQQQEQEQKE